MGEIASLKTQTRRVKARALDAIEAVLMNPESVSKDFYQQLLLKIAGNVIPRSQEISGEDGESIKIAFDKVFENGTSSITSKATGDSEEPSEI